VWTTHQLLETSPHPWEPHATRNQQQQRWWRAEEKARLAPAGERDLLFGACHPLSKQWVSNERWLMSLEAEDNGGHGGEVRGMQKLAEMCRCRLEIIDPKTLPIFVKTTKDEGDSQWFLGGYTRKQIKKPLNKQIWLEWNLAGKPP